MMSEELLEEAIEKLEELFEEAIDHGWNVKKIIVRISGNIGEDGTFDMMASIVKNGEENVADRS